MLLGSQLRVKKAGTHPANEACWTPPQPQVNKVKGFEALPVQPLLKTMSKHRSSIVQSLVRYDFPLECEQHTQSSRSLAGRQQQTWLCQ